MPTLVLRRIPISLPSIQLYTFASIILVGFVVMWAGNEYERTLVSEAVSEKPPDIQLNNDVVGEKHAVENVTEKPVNITSYAQGMVYEISYFCILTVVIDKLIEIVEKSV